MADERNPLPMDVPDFVREAEEAMARGETFGQPLAEVTIKFGKDKSRGSVLSDLSDRKEETAAARPSGKASKMQEAAR